MSFDIYCYRPKSSVPNIEEARALVESDEVDAPPIDKGPSETQSRIVEALLAFNPRLERFQFDYKKIAEQMRITEDQARARFSHVELNTPKDSGPVIQLTVRSDHVFLSVPYWYSGARADQVFDQLNGYMRVIRDTAGFFVYDPQEARVFDPATTSIQDHSRYEEIVRRVPAIDAQSVTKERKPWWKFW